MVNGQEVKSKRGKGKAEGNRGLLLCQAKTSGLFKFRQMQDSLSQDEGNCLRIKNLRMIINKTVFIHC
jgi:hypothetical protein